jgi:hypothetical protein
MVRRRSPELHLLLLSRTIGTMTRRVLLMFGLLSIAALGLAGFWLLWPSSAINRENAAKIRDGMSLAEVEAILGGPARDDSTGPVMADLHDDDGRPLTERELIRTLAGMWENNIPAPKFWRSNQVMIGVHLDPSGRVARCEVLRVRRIQAGPMDILRRWFGL